MNLVFLYKLKLIIKIEINLTYLLSGTAFHGLVYVAFLQKKMYGNYVRIESRQNLFIPLAAQAGP